MLGLYCSKECWRKFAAGVHLRTGGYRKCATCGESYYLRGAYISDPGRRFCSVLCYQEQRRIVAKVCAVCSKTFPPHRKTQKFCSYRCSKLGNLNPNYTGNPKRQRTSSREWLRNVYTRDRFTCVKCKATNCRLAAHHLDGYQWCVERRTDVTNGVTLCAPCHRLFHKLYGRHNNTEQQFKEWQALRPQP